eukprot:3874703-Rhodomonas_salina.4
MNIARLQLRQGGQVRPVLKPRTAPSELTGPCATQPVETVVRRWATISSESAADEQLRASRLSTPSASTFTGSVDDVCLTLPEPPPRLPGLQVRPRFQLASSVVAKEAEPSSPPSEQPEFRVSVSKQSGGAVRSGGAG